MSSDTWCLASGALGGGVAGPLRSRAWAGRFMSVGSMPLLAGLWFYPFPATVLMPGEQHPPCYHMLPVNICYLTQAPKPNQPWSEIGDYGPKSIIPPLK